MPTRREQLQAYRFTTHRIVMAMLSGEPESSMTPMRRLGLGAFASFMIATLVFAGVGVYGLLRPGGKDSWKKDGTFVIERGSGARYIYQDKKLHPVLNYASARLIVGAKSAQDVSSQSLRGASRGAPVGIQGAPDSLPDADSLLGLPWIVCSSPRFASSTAALATELMVGRAVPGGRGLGDKALIVTEGTKDGTMYLLWKNHRYRVRDTTALAALGLTGASRSVVGTAMLGAVPQGPDLAVPNLPGKGDPGGNIGGVKRSIGDVFRSGDAYYVLTRGGLAIIHEVMAKLLLGGAEPSQVSASDVAGNLDRRPFEHSGFPHRVPAIMSLPDGQPATCVGYRGASDESDTQVALRVYRQTPDRLKPDPNSATQASGARDAGPVADRIVVPGGHGALVREESEPGVTAGTTVYLVTDRGHKYALVKSGKKDAKALLGYGGKKPTAMPKAMLDLVPTGPGLDPTVAGNYVQQLPPSPTASPAKHDG